MKKSNFNIINIITIMGFLLSIAFVIYGIRTKIFVSPEALQHFLDQFGIFADIIFVLVQGVQVVVPIIPGSLGCLAGVIIFGPLKGFIYNYIGICIGSLIAFSLARRYGKEFVKKMSKPKLIEKYSSWLYNEKFDKWFALAIFLPVAPDDFLCYLAGITKISIKKFSLIILAGKPFAIAAYSMGLNLIFTSFMQYLTSIR